MTGFLSRQLTLCSSACRGSFETLPFHSDSPSSCLFYLPWSVPDANLIEQCNSFTRSDLPYTSVFQWYDKNKLFWRKVYLLLQFAILSKRQTAKSIGCFSHQLANNQREGHVNTSNLVISLTSTHRITGRL